MKLERLDFGAIVLSYVAVVLLLLCSDLNPMLLNNSYHAFVNEHPRLLSGVLSGGLAYLAIVSVYFEVREKRSEG